MKRKTYIITNELKEELGAFPTYKAAQMYIKNILTGSNYTISEQAVNLTNMYTNEEMESLLEANHYSSENTSTTAKVYGCSEELVRLVEKLSDFYFQKGFMS